MRAELHAFLRSRRSIRRFKTEPVPEDLLHRLLETAIHAPSAHNLQPWRFVLVQNATARERLGRALTDKMRADMEAKGALETDIAARVERSLYGQTCPQSATADIAARVERSLRRLSEAPVVLLFCRDTAAVRDDTPEEHHMGVQSVANAATYLLLAAHAEGLGGNWICWPLYAPAETRAALNLPAAWQPEGMLFLGWPDETPGEKRLRAGEVVRR